MSHLVSGLCPSRRPVPSSPVHNHVPLRSTTGPPRFTWGFQRLCHPVVVLLETAGPAPGPQEGSPPDVSSGTGPGRVDVSRGLEDTGVVVRVGATVGSNSGRPKELQTPGTDSHVPATLPPPTGQGQTRIINNFSRSDENKFHPPDDFALQPNPLRLGRVEVYLFHP